MQVLDGFDESHDLPDSSSNGLTYPHISNPTGLGRAYRDVYDAGRAIGPQPYTNPFANIHPPMVPLFQQNCDSPPRTMDPRDMTLPPFDKALKPFDNGPLGFGLWKSPYSTASTAGVPSLGWGTDHNLSPLKSAFEAPRISHPTPFAPAPGSEILGHGYQDVYGPHSWDTGSFHHHQHQHQYQQADIPADRGKSFDGQPWTTHQEDSPK